MKGYFFPLLGLLFGLSAILHAEETSTPPSPVTLTMEIKKTDIPNTTATIYIQNTSHQTINLDRTALEKPRFSFVASKSLRSSSWGTWPPKSDIPLQDILADASQSATRQFQLAPSEVYSRDIPVGDVIQSELKKHRMTDFQMATMRISYDHLIIGVKGSDPSLELFSLSITSNGVELSPPSSDAPGDAPISLTGKMKDLGPKNSILTLILQNTSKETLNLNQAALMAPQLTFSYVKGEGGGESGIETMRKDPAPAVEPPVVEQFDDASQNPKCQFKLAPGASYSFDIPVAGYIRKKLEQLEVADYDSASIEVTLTHLIIGIKDKDPSLELFEENIKSGPVELVR